MAQEETFTRIKPASLGDWVAWNGVQAEKLHFTLTEGNYAHSHTLTPLQRFRDSGSAGTGSRGPNLEPRVKRETCAKCVLQELRDTLLFPSHAQDQLSIRGNSRYSSEIAREGVGGILGEVEKEDRRRRRRRLVLSLVGWLVGFAGPNSVGRRENVRGDLDYPLDVHWFPIWFCEYFAWHNGTRIFREACINILGWFGVGILCRETRRRALCTS